MQSITIPLPDLVATRTLGHALGRSLPPGTIVLLSGDLGAGKTSLVQGIGEGLGITEPITSPTFALIQEYLEGTMPLYHLDLYRLEPADVAGLFIEQYWEGIECPLGIVAIEWAERMPHRPDAYLQIALTMTAGDRRSATLTWIGDAPSPLPEVQQAIAQSPLVP
ncbi:MAG: tRNA (adenosine(37)-N6)-threonylcarbamoyltransferase complex ATPase subunit type 1 TsaE [Synechococcales cyanobacterium T60_A2020_003]|nr:tRNA (adenosine(37)-N6)-threonylcarbamoyltransferase complex ATPase subunit type 1 TsaE [Synechococcales cyanobacterium T60_A2020_003]